MPTDTQFRSNVAALTEAIIDAMDTGDGRARQYVDPASLNELRGGFCRLIETTGVIAKALNESDNPVEVMEGIAQLGAMCLGIIYATSLVGDAGILTEILRMEAKKGELIE